MHVAVRLALLTFTATPWMAHATNTICCDVNGKTYCDYGVPAACQGKAYRILGLNGAVLREVAAPLTPEQKAKRDLELARQRAEEERKAEQDRQDRKLVSSYPTLTDLDIGHERQLADMKKSQQQLEQKLLEAEKKKKQLANEAEFYQKRAMPPSLQGQIDDNNKDIDNQKKAIIGRGKDIDAAKLRFEEEKQRYTRLTANIPERQR